MWPAQSSTTVVLRNLLIGRGWGWSHFNLGSPPRPWPWREQPDPCGLPMSSTSELKCWQLHWAPHGVSGLVQQACSSTRGGRLSSWGQLPSPAPPEAVHGRSSCSNKESKQTLLLGGRGAKKLGTRPWCCCWPWEVCVGWGECKQLGLTPLVKLRDNRELPGCLIRVELQCLGPHFPPQFLPLLYDEVHCGASDILHGSRMSQSSLSFCSLHDITRVLKR